MKIYLIWLFGVIVWNYGVPQATPLQDVLAAIALSFFFSKHRFKKIFNKIIILMKSIYFDNKQ